VESRKSLDFVRLAERGDGDPGEPSVLVIGTLDTKREEIVFLATAIVDAGAQPVLLDSSVAAGDTDVPFPLITRAEVAHASGSTIDEVTRLPRGEAVEKMQAGVRDLTEALASSDRVQGAICIGGAGAYLAAPAFQVLDVGFPKMMVSPLASGKREFEPYVGLRDVTVMHSVADIAGVNAITEPVYHSAAGYIAGAARSYARLQGNGAEKAQAGPMVAISMNGNTTKAMDRGRARFEAAGYTAVIFHANGVGGRALEDFVASGRADAVLDFTTTELGADLVGGLMVAGPDRMEAAGRKGIPQVLVPGCVDFITCGTWEATEAEFPGRTMFRHNPELTLVRLTAEEMGQLGTTFAHKANTAIGPTAILVPARGFSVPDAEAGPFWDPAADRAFLDALQAEIRPEVKVEVWDAHINDPDFADASVDTLVDLVDESAVALGRAAEAEARGPA
jgi:uncharacterized protein (UPF0261 family)